MSKIEKEIKDKLQTKLFFIADQIRIDFQLGKISNKKRLQLEKKLLESIKKEYVKEIKMTRGK